VHIDVPLAKPRSGRDLDDAAGLANVDPKRQAAIEKDPGPARRCIAAGVTRHDGRLAIGPTGVLIVEPPGVDHSAGKIATRHGNVVGPQEGEDVVPDGLFAEIVRPALFDLELCRCGCCDPVRNSAARMTRMMAGRMVRYIWIVVISRGPSWSWSCARPPSAIERPSLIRSPLGQRLESTRGLGSVRLRSGSEPPSIRSCPDAAFTRNLAPVEAHIIRLQAAPARPPGRRSRVRRPPDQRGRLASQAPRRRSGPGCRSRTAPRQSWPGQCRP
jgi:hypothetical protein